MTRSRLPRLLAPKIVGVTVVAAVLTAAMTVAGLWQLDAYNDTQALDAAETARAQPVPLDRLLRPDQAFTAEAHARPVVVRGRYAEPQVLVDRGDDRPWLVTPLVTDTGAAVLVVRGIAPAHGLPAPPPGRIRLVGSLQPSEARGDDGDLSDDRVPTLSTAQLIGDYEQDLYSGFVVLTEQQPPSALPEATPPQPDASFTAGLRNLMYALQWWVFGGFVIFVWWRMLREEGRVA